MQLYTTLSKIGFLKKSYAIKFLFVAFLGIHVPLIGLIFFLVFFEEIISPSTVFILTLVMTLVATAITLLVLKKLIKPIEVASKALQSYRMNRTIPELESEFSDEVGDLMNNIQGTITSNENLLTQKQDLVYLFSHDLKNYAQNPSQLAQLILEEDPSETVAGYAKLILQSTEKQQDFLYTFIKLIKEEEELSKKPVRIKSVEIPEIVTEVRNQLQPKMLAKNITLKENIEVDSVALKIDKNLLNGVISNLIDNAIKFSYPGSTVELNIAKEHSLLQISVGDSGVGFESSKSDLLFKKFTVMSRPGTENEKSVGIGLYLCNQIMKRSDGEIYAQSRGLEQGATFFVNLKMYKKR